MNYFKILLNSNTKAYALREYFPYTDKLFFKSIDDLLLNEDFGLELVYSLIKLYKEDLLFLNEKLIEYEYIVPVKHKSLKFTNLNQKICKMFADELGISVIDDYFDKINLSGVDIRDEYIREDAFIDIEINKRYKSKPVIIFDICCSTGIIFSKISNDINFCKHNLMLSYGVRFNAAFLSNTSIIDVIENSFELDKYERQFNGYLIRIYGLFGNKNVDVDLRDYFSIIIGENGYGKSTATKLAILVIKYINDINNESLRKNLANFYFDKIEVYSKNNYFVKKTVDINKNLVLGGRVYHAKYEFGTILQINDTSCKVKFENEDEIIREINKDFLAVVDDNDNNSQKEFKVTFMDEHGNLLFEQIVNANEKINVNDLPDYELQKYKYYCSDIDFKKYSSKGFAYLDFNELQSIIIKRNLVIKISDFDYNNYTENLLALISTVSYNDIIPSKDKLIEELDDYDVKDFLSKITNNEFFDIIRKLILKDRSIEINYKDVQMKYRLSYNINDVDLKLRDYFYDYYNYNNLNCIISNDENEFGLEHIYLNCAKSRKILSKKSHDSIELTYFDNDEYIDLNEKSSNVYYITPNIKNNSVDDYEDHFEEDPLAYCYDDPDDFNPYEDDLGNDYEYIEYDFDEEDEYDFDEEDQLDLDKYSNIDNEDINRFYKDPSGLIYIDLSTDRNISLKSIINNYSKIFPANFKFKKREFDLEDEEINYNDDYISMHKIIYYKFFNHIVNTNFYALVDEIIEYDNNKIIGIKFSNQEILLERIITPVFKENVSKIYKDVFGAKYHYFSFGIYDLLEDTTYNKLNKIINRLKIDGIKNNIDYLLVIGLGLLLVSYKKTFISNKHIIFEKIINKYFVNKSVKIYANDLAIVDMNNNYIPIEFLSTGEKNLLNIFLFCLSHNNKFIILDEPDISMSVDWQSRVLIDLLKFTDNRYMIITQSPLLVQKNGLATFVKRMDCGVIENYKLDLLIRKTTHENTKLSS